jgi:predicted DNA-binding transcriptional regulator YafY
MSAPRLERALLCARVLCSGWHTIDDLAAALLVSPRTVKRYMGAMRAAGYTVVSDGGDFVPAEHGARELPHLFHAEVE